MIETNGNDSNGIIRGYIGAGVFVVFCGLIAAALIAVEAMWANVAAAILLLVAVIVLGCVIQERAHAQNIEIKQEARKTDLTAIELTRIRGELARLMMAPPPATSSAPQLPPPDTLSFTQHGSRTWVRDPDPAPVQSQPSQPAEELPDPAILLALAALIERGQQPSLARVAEVVQSAGGRWSDNNNYTTALNYLGDVWVERGGQRQQTRWRAGVLEGAASTSAQLRAAARAMSARE